MAWPPPVYALIDELAAAIKAALGADLVGLYLYGSLVSGDFDEWISDVDLLSATRSDLSAGQFHHLDQVHRRLELHHPAWVDRIEIAYLSTQALATFRQVRSPIAVISPGTAFHVADAGRDWLINWYLVRTQGLTLVGPPATELISEISTAEVRQAVRAQTQRWRRHVHSAHHPGFQAYAILTACRALHTYEHGTIASKRRSAHWAMEQLPSWTALIEHALYMRTLGGHVGQMNKDDTVRFVTAVADRIAASPTRS